MKTLSPRCHKGHSAAVTAFYRLVGERGVYWQKSERLTSEKETKLNWIREDFSCCSNPRPSPKLCHDTDAEGHQRNSELLWKGTGTGREAWAATGDGILPVETRYPSGPDLGLYGLFLLLFKTRQLYKFYSEKSQRRNSPRPKVTIKWLNLNRKPTESWAYPLYEDTSFPSTSSWYSVQERQICKQVHTHSHALTHTTAVSGVVRNNYN